MKQVWSIVYESPTPSIEGPVLIRQGEWQTRKEAEQAIKIVEARSERSPKKNLHIQTRHVTQWTDD
jgi:hypothetical protein